MNIDIRALEEANASKPSSAARKFAPKAKPRAPQAQASAQPSSAQQDQPQATSNQSYEAKEQPSGAVEPRLRHAVGNPPGEPVEKLQSHSRGLELLDHFLSRAEKPQEAQPAEARHESIATKPPKPPDADLTEPAPDAPEEEEAGADEDPAWSSERTRKPRNKKATGRRNGKRRKRHLSTEETANMDLDAGRDSISKFVARANAQERLRIAERKRQRAEKLESIGPLGDVPALPAPPQDRSRSGLEMELVDGKLVPKAQSLVIQAQAAPLFQEVTEYSNVVNNASYMHKAICDRWRPEETEMFFQAIAQLGTNFELIAKLFPRRDRTSLKNKWRRENKRNPQRVSEVLQHPANPEKLQRLVEALGKATEDGTDELCIQAADLFPQATPAEAPQPLEDEPPAPQRNRKRRTAEPASLLAPAPPRRGSSRRKAEPTQSLPADFCAPSERKGKSKSDSSAPTRRSSRAAAKRAVSAKDGSPTLSSSGEQG